MRLIDDVGVFLVLQLGLLLVGALQILEILEKQDPRRLLGVIEFGGASILFPQDVVDILKCLLEQARPPRSSRPETIRRIASEILQYRG